MEYDDTGSTTATPTTATPTTVRPTRRDRFAHDVRLIVATIVLAALVVFAIDNRKQTSVSWIVGDGRAPLWILLIAAAVAGAIVGALASHRSARHHH